MQSFTRHLFCYKTAISALSKTIETQSSSGDTDSVERRHWGAALEKRMVVVQQSSWRFVVPVHGKSPASTAQSQRVSIAVSVKTKKWIKAAVGLLGPVPHLSYRLGSASKVTHRANNSSMLQLIYRPLKDSHWSTENGHLIFPCTFAMRASSKILPCALVSSDMISLEL